MAESKTSLALHDSSLTSQLIGAASAGPSPAREAAPTHTPYVPHGCTLQFLISIIKNSQQRNPSPHSE